MIITKKQLPADLWARYNTYIYGHDVWQICYEAATSRMSAIPPSDAEKLLNPALIDVGPANIKIATAIDLLLDYQQAQSGIGEDPLQLLDKGYTDGPYCRRELPKEHSMRSYRLDGASRK